MSPQLLRLLVLPGRLSKWTAFAVVAATAALLSGCGSDNPAEPPNGPTAPLPQLSAIQPSFASVGTLGPLPIRIIGTGFTDRSRVSWNGAERTTRLIGPTQLEIALESADLNTIRTATVAVFTSAPGGGVSNSLNFPVVNEDAPTPRIDALAPTRITAGWGTSFTLTITGDGFTAQSIVRWDGTARETEYVSKTTLRVRVSAADVAQARDIEVSVETSAPGGGRDAVIFPVRAVPTDRVDLLSPYGASWTWVNHALPFQAVPRSANGAELTDRRAMWRVHNIDIATVTPTGDLSARAVGGQRGITVIEAVVDDVAVARPLVVHEAPHFDIVYGAGIGPDQHLMLWPLATGEAPRRLPIPLTAFDPSPSPSGRDIVFAGVPRDQIFGGNYDVYVAARDGTDLRRLTTDNAVDYEPAWSPDGSRIAFTSLRGGMRNVWTMNADGTNAQRLTDAHPDGIHAGSGISAGSAAWSPDGSQLVYSVGGPQNSSALWIMRADGNNKRPLTSGAIGSAYEPAWSADGLHIAFRRESGSPRQVTLSFVAATDGSTSFPILNTTVMSATPHFSPDGAWLLASNTPLGSSSTLYAVPLTVAGDPRVVLPTSLGGARSARWIRRP